MHRPRSSSAWGRKLALPAILATLALALLAPVAAFSAPLTSVFVNGVRIDTYPEIRNGVSYLPINAMAQALKAEISWDSRLNSVKVNGEVVQATAYNIDGKIYLPVESFVSALGGSVVYDGRESAIRVQTSGGMTAMAPGAPVPASTPAPASTPQARTTVQIPPVSSTPAARPPATSTVPVAPASASGGYSTSGGYTTPGNYPSSGGYSPNTTNPGTPEPYLSNPQQASTNMRPVDARPSLGAGLEAGPLEGGPGPSASVAAAPMPANAQRPNEVYVPRSAQNAVFQVTVTNLENVTVIKDFYRPRTGYKFVVVYLSQQNISEQVQIYTGRFSLLDQKNTSYDYIEGLSNFWLVILRPFGINFGYLVYEVPVDAKPMNLVLHALNQAPLTLNL